MPTPEAEADTIVAMLEQVGRERTALSFDGEELSYGDLLDASRKLTKALQDKGIVRGDRVAVMLPNGMAWFVIMAACARLGVAMVSLNVRLGPHEVGDLISRSRCKAIFFDSANRGGAIKRTLASVDPDRLATLHLRVDVASSDDPAPDGVTRLQDLIRSAGPESDITGEGQGDDVFVMIPTSGTTSLPKLVMHTQERVVGHLRDIGRAFGLPRDGRFLLAIPLCGGFGFTTAMTCLAAGLTLEVVGEFDPKVTGDLMISKGVTHAFGTNDMLAALIEAHDGDEPFPALKMYGNANFTPGLDCLPARARALGIPMIGMFGLTETLAFLAAHDNDTAVERRANGGGRLVCPSASFRVRNEETGNLADKGTPGELEVKTPHCMIGYFEDEERTAAAFTADGYLRTGDIVIDRGDESFDFVSRAGDMLRIGGYLVSPAEIEGLIEGIEGVQTCQVVAVNQDGKARPAAFVIAQPGLDLSEEGIRETCAGQLAVYKRPVRIFFIDEMPTIAGPNGAKVQKNVLREMAGKSLASNNEKV
ncbi:MAG: AMP-binding protein [Novosphingobium sp.]